MTDIYCIPMGYKSQDEPLKAHCFGDCGKISMGGAVDLGEYGPAWVCCEKECPYEKGVVGPVGTSELTGDTIYIRAVQVDEKPEQSR